MKLENFSVKCRTQLTVHNLFGGETEKELSEMIAAVKNQLADVSTLFWSNFLLCWYKKNLYAQQACTITVFVLCYFYHKGSMDTPE